MKIRKITIKNFRGVKELDWALPASDIFCLIGKGDSSKSTILEAIRFTFYPQWNLTLSDSDFYQCKVENTITIEVTIGNLAEEFCSLHKYGPYLRGWDAAARTLTDEPDDHLENTLTVRLTVEKDLEPKWIVVCDRNPEGAPFKQADRNKVSVGLIGAYSEKQLSWANGTALAKITKAQSLNELLANVSRNARTSLDTERDVNLANFDAAAAKSQEMAKLLGVPVVDAYKAHLDLGSINLKVGGLSLHDGDMRHPDSETELTEIPGIGPKIAEQLLVAFRSVTQVKNATMAKGAKANHLSYLGDGTVGPKANIGAGTIFCNYDGFDKFETHVGAGAFIGSNSALVAPVTVGAGAYTGSGSVITRDVAPDALGLERAVQVEKPGWAARFRAMKLARKTKT